MFPLEQALQSGISFLKSGIGLEVVNYTIALVVASSVFAQIFRVPQFFGGCINTPTTACICLYVWSLLTIIWSPGKAIAFNMINSGFPYLIITVFLGPLLTDSILSFSKTCRAMLIIGIPIACIFLFSSEFEMTSGRLSIHLSSDVSSNVLAVGEFGGLLIITAVLFQPKSILVYSNYALRFILVIAGVVICIKSGSRGQFFGAIIVSLMLIPFSIPIKNIQKFFINFIGIILFLIVVYYTYNLSLADLSTGSSKRFDLYEMLFGTSSAEGRFSNISGLFSAWISSPIYYLIGLGIGAFGTTSQSGDIYTHNLTADTLFELGIIGFILFVICIISALKSCYRLFMYYSMMPEQRSVVTVLIGYIFYEFILANKQGALWGIPLLFLFTSIAGRLEKRVLFAEEYSQPRDLDWIKANSVAVIESDLNINDLDLR